MTRTARALLAGVLLTLGAAAACNFPFDPGSWPAAQSPSPWPAAGPPYDATVRLLAPTGPVNRQLLGSNIQWLDDGDGLLRSGTNEFAPAVLARLDEIGPTVLRYPGGSNTDVYQWRAGQGPPSARGTSEHFHTKARQKVLLGTAEFLALCARVGAEPLISVNTATGTAEDAAAWVRAVNKDGMTGKDGKPLPRVRFWEIGNEPYLREEVRKEIAVPPEEYAKRADAFIKAMRAVDPSITVGLPVRTDTIGGIPAVHFPGFADTVLAGVKQPYDFLALHNSYLPVAFDPSRPVSDEELFRAAMAASAVVREDLAATRALLAEHRPSAPVPLAITEYNALFTLGGRCDDYVATLGGALYIADLLATLCNERDVLMANHWSFCGNWHFGAVTSNGQVRPAYHVLCAYRRVLRGDLLGTDVQAPTFDVPQVGFVPARSGLPLVTSLATRDGHRVRLLLINKDPARPARVGIEGAAAKGAVDAQVLAAGKPFDPRDATALAGFRPLAVTAEPVLSVEVPAHALAVLEWDSAPDGGN